MSIPTDPRGSGTVCADLSTRDTLLHQHLGLVYHVANELSRALAHDVELDDLVSAGTLGLIKALEHFEPTRGLSLSTFAVPRIRGAMLDELRRVDRVPRSVRRKTRQIDVMSLTLAGSLGRAPQPGELADGLGIDTLTLWRWQAEREWTRFTSIDRALSGADNGRRVSDWVNDVAGADVDEVITQDQEAARLRDALLDLSEQERTVVSLYYFDELKLRDIARILDVTESRVSQIHSKALQKLRRKLARLRTPAA